MRCVFHPNLFAQKETRGSKREELRSGRWLGWYRQSGRTFSQTLDLHFNDGFMQGYGADSIGPFIVIGKYDNDSRIASWLKSYVGAHHVFYSGAISGDMISGTWQIRNPPGPAISDTFELRLEPLDQSEGPT